LESESAVKIGIAIHDGTYSVDYAVHRLCAQEDARKDENSEWIADHIVAQLEAYRKEHVCKILGAGVTLELHHKSPNLCSQLWQELDIVPIVVESNPLLPSTKSREKRKALLVDEIADSAARKCLA
jgi:hypothetical protein